MLLAVIAVVLASISLVLSIPVYIAIRKVKPMINKSMSIIGSLGKQAQVANEEVAEVEEALTEGVLDLVAQKYPEAGLVLMYLEENHPEIIDKIKERPAIILGIVEKYAPLVQQLMGKNAGTNKPVTFDV